MFFRLTHMEQIQDQNTSMEQVPQFTAPAPKSNVAFIIIINTVISVIVAFVVTFIWQIYFDVKLEKINTMEKQVSEKFQEVQQKTDRIRVVN